MATAMASPNSRPPEGTRDAGEVPERSWAEIAAERDGEVESLNLTVGEEPFRLSSWEVKKRRALGQGQDNSQREQEEMVRRSNSIQMREGDWRCVMEGCRGEINFARRRECWKCGADKTGIKRAQGATSSMLGQSPDPRRDRSLPEQSGFGLSPTERLKRRVEEHRGPLRRQPTMIILTINVTIDGKTQGKPAAKDHYDIIKQAGLDKVEVKGVVAKPGYLEVALVTGAASLAGALRETSKEVNSRIIITSVKEKGANRVVVIKWQDVSLEVKDETLIQYTDLFAVPEKSEKRLWWDKVKEGDESSMVGTWTGERSLAVRLKPNIGYIPTWHFVGGTKLKLYVPGRKNCQRCLKSVGECRGGGDWRKCENSKVSKGDWKEEQENFLEKLGWGQKKQKIMEGLEDQLPKLVGEEEEEEATVLESQAEIEAEKREGLVQQLGPSKECRGILLRNFPEGEEGKETGNRELLMTVMVLSNLEEEREKNRFLQAAKVEKRRTDRGGKKTLDLKISLEGEDLLLMKVWRQLEKFCRQEGVKRFQIEAKSVVSPVKKKVPTELEKAREKVKQILEQESRLKKAEAEKVVDPTFNLTELGENLLNPARPESRPVQGLLALTYMEDSIMQPRQNGEVTREEKKQPKEVKEMKEEDARSNSQKSGLEVKPSGKQNKQKQPKEDLDKLRVNTPSWQPPEGMRRCGHNCSGCSKRCAEQGLEDCQHCSMKIDLEKTHGEKVVNYICFNRGECVNLRELRKRSNSRGGVSNTKVGAQNIVFKPGQVAETKEAIDRQAEEAEKKRGREETGNTPEKRGAAY